MRSLLASKCCCWPPLPRYVSFHTFQASTRHKPSHQPYSQPSSSALDFWNSHLSRNPGCRITFLESPSSYTSNILRCVGWQQHSSSGDRDYEKHRVRAVRRAKLHISRAKVFETLKVNTIRVASDQLCALAGRKWRLSYVLRCSSAKSS